MRPAFPALAALVLLAPTATALAGVSLPPLLGTPSTEYVVGFEPGGLDAVRTVLTGAGGVVLKSSDELGLAVVSSANPLYLATALLSPLVDFAETNDLVHAAGTEWNGAEWNGVEWNGAEWNGAEWNGAEWNSDGGATADPGTGFQWALPRIGADVAWRVSTGARRAILCTVDSGVDASHADIARNYAFSWNAITGTSNAGDDGGHGTHMAGIAAGVIGNSYGIAGVGNVRIAAAKALKADGTGKEADVALGLAWCADHGAKVALLALASGPSNAMDRAISYAASRDVLVVASAGNVGPCTNCVAYPARNPATLAVASFGPTGAPSVFSATGPEVDLSAPGEKIIGPWPGGRFMYGSGTSQAAAVVAGAAALLRDALPTLSAGGTRALLEKTAVDAGIPGKDPVYGNGAVNVGSAFRSVGVL